MATDFSALIPPFIRRVTLSTADQAEKVTFPEGGFIVDITFDGDSGKIGYAGTDGVALDSDKYMTLTAGTTYREALRRNGDATSARTPYKGGRKLYFESATAPVTFSLAVN